jgi:hypothetical protein
MQFSIGFLRVTFTSSYEIRENWPINGCASRRRLKEFLPVFHTFRDRYEWTWTWKFYSQCGLTVRFANIGSINAIVSLRSEIKFYLYLYLYLYVFLSNEMEFCKKGVHKTLPKHCDVRTVRHSTSCTVLTSVRKFVSILSTCFVWFGRNSVWENGT